jgi:GAF domain-containing protein
MSETRENAVIKAFVDLSNELVEGYDMVELLASLTDSCARLLHIAAAGLLLTDRHGVLHLVAASSDRARTLEVFQLQRDEGPCLDCYREGEVVIVPDLSTETARWPQFCQAAASAGFTSVHALPMRLRDKVLGALGLFGDEVGRLDDHDLELAQALVHVASVAIVNERASADSETVNAQLQAALDSRVVLEQAKGVVAQAGGVDMATAFDALRRFARDRSARLTDICAAVVERRLSGAEVLQHVREVAGRSERDGRPPR